MAQSHSSPNLQAGNGGTAVADAPTPRAGDARAGGQGAAAPTSDVVEPSPPSAIARVLSGSASWMLSLVIHMGLIILPKHKQVWII